MIFTTPIVSIPVLDSSLVGSFDQQCKCYKKWVRVRVRRVGTEHAMGVSNYNLYWLPLLTG